MNSLSATFDQIDAYFDYCIDLLCSRCSNNPKIHHAGLINTFLKPHKHLSIEFFANYFTDAEQGLFQGIMRGFIINLLHQDKNLTQGGQCIMEKELCSAFLHDILKCNGFSPATCLAEFYPELKDETYLIMADRIDSKGGLAAEPPTALFINMEARTRQYIELLLHFYVNRDNIFIRHGLEDLSKGAFAPADKFPPKNSYLEIGKGYPIEIDRPPFAGCSNHDIKAAWNKVKGYLTFDKFCHLGGRIIDSKKRDHLYATSEIKLKDWCFTYQNIKEDNLQITQLIANDIAIIPQKIINKFYTLNNLLKDRMRVLNYCL